MADQTQPEKPKYTGAMIAFFLSPEDAQALNVPVEGALPPDERHITLVFLGDTAKDDLEKSAYVSALGEFATFAPCMRGAINGYGRFGNGDNDGEETNAIYANFDAPALPAWRQRLIETLQSRNLSFAQNHGYTPHTTLAYIPAEMPTPDLRLEPRKLAFDTVWLAWGDERIPFKLNGAPEYRNPEAALDKRSDGARISEFIGMQPAKVDGFTGREWEVTLIGRDPRDSGSLVQAGGREFIRSKNKGGLLYSVDALQSSTNLFEGVQVYDNHLTQEEFVERGTMRSPSREWVGNIVGVTWDKQERCMRGNLKVVDEALASKLKAAYELGIEKGRPGLSIDTFPVYGSVTIEGRQIVTVEGFGRVISVDVVMNPAAGGSIDRAVAAIQESQKEFTMNPEEIKKLITRLVMEALAGTKEERRNQVIAGVVKIAEAMALVDEASAEKALRPVIEAMATLEPVAQPAPVAPPPTEDPASVGVKEALAEAKAALAQMRALECQMARDRKISAAKLPEKLAALVTEAYPDGKEFDLAQVDTFIARAKEAQVAADPSGRVLGVGGQPDVTFDEADKAEVEFTRLLMGNTDFRKLEGNTEDFVQDRVTESYRAWVKAGRPNYGTTRMSEWVRRLLGGDPMIDPRAYEAMTTSSMSSIIKNAMNVMLAASYSKRQRWYESIVKVEEVDSIDDPTLVRTFGFNTLQVVNEGDAYAEMAGADEEETASFVKKGNFAGVTLEALLRDKVNEIRRVPDKLANAWYNTLSAMVAGVFTTNTAAGPVLSDGGALFNATAVGTGGGHANLLTAALSYAAFSAARTAMRKQTDRPLGAGQRLLIEPRYLLVPVDLETTGLQIRNSEKVPVSMDNDVNPFFQKFDVIPVPEWTDATDWAIMGDPQLWPAIYLIFLRGLRVPELFTADNEAAGALFTNDTIRYKVRMMTFRYSSTYDVAPVSDWRGLHKSNV